MVQKEKASNPNHMINLYNNIQKHNSSCFFPPELMSAVREAATADACTSPTSDKDNDLGMAYENTVAKVAEFMLKRVSQPMAEKKKEKKMTSEETYTISLLGLYDTLVWGFNSPFLWRIQEQEIRSLYEANISENHCEIAVGTGLFLSSRGVSNHSTKMTLIDLNANSLNSCEDRIQRSHSPDTEAVTDISMIVADITIAPEEESVLTPLKGKFHSVAANFLFHCLRGSNLNDKFNAFQNCASLVDPEDGVFFGSTILGREIMKDSKNAGKTTLHVMEKFNDWGVFGNIGDTYEDLERILRGMFRDVELKRVGYCGVWRASRPRKQNIT
mmetsp:Transcript_21742/g.44860  ORF Transcript_21742/g.44860 Transcript_21742/m.44860 type:complete len:329 (-) Transcript_21742:2385-3371(-)